MKKIDWNRARAESGWIVATVLALTLVGTVLAVNPSFQTGPIGPGSFVQSCTYLVFTDGTNYFRKTCQTGSVDASGASATTIIQNALDSAVTVHGSVSLAPGTYRVHGLTLANGTSAVQGVSLRGTGGAFQNVVLLYDGAPGGTILTTSGWRWGTIDGIDFNGNNTAATALSVQGLVAAGSYNVEISNSVFHFTTSYGILLGASNNYQVSNVELRNVNVLDVTGGTALQIIGSNTLSIVVVSSEFSRSATGVNVTSGDLFGYGVTTVSNTVVDYRIQATTAPVFVSGGYTEQSHQFMNISCYNVPVSFQSDVAVVSSKILPNSPGALEVHDCGQGNTLFSNDIFQSGSVLWFKSNFAAPFAAAKAQKRFVDSIFFNNAGSPVNGSAQIRRGAYMGVQVVFQGPSFNLAPTPFASWGSDSGVDPWSLGGSHSAAPTGSFRNYTVDGQNALITSTGGTGVSIWVFDGKGNSMIRGVATLSTVFVPLGYSITFGAFSGAPTVTVWFSGV